MFVDKNEKLWQELSSIADDEGLLLYDIERFGDASLRVFISKKKQDAEVDEDPAESSKPREGFVTSDDCSRMCRRLMVMMTVEGPGFGLGTEPFIEVSSPGMNRHLRLADHFEQAIGKRVKVTIKGDAELEGIKPGAYIGTLEDFKENVVTVVEEGSGRRIQAPKEALRQAQIEFSF